MHKPKSFSGGQGSGRALRLVARARQFSSYVLMAGKILSEDEFDPTCAIIVSNKDELLIPILLETLPTPKEFRDAIVSLSPEQQRFAKAFRSMQLSSTLFGLVVVQIKPQMETVLNLPQGSLTKEIQLHQDLADMFIKYQVPSDLMYFDGDPTTDANGKVAAVAGHVAKLKDIIAAAKAEEILHSAEERLKATMESHDADEVDGAGPNVERRANKNAKRHMRKYAGENLDMMYHSGSAQPTGSAPPPIRLMAKSILLDAPEGEGMESGRGAAPPPVGHKQPPPPQPRPGPGQHDGNAESRRQGDASSSTGGEDYTKLPGLLDEAFDRLDIDSALRPTRMNLGPTWTMKTSRGLLSAPETKRMSESGQKEERAKAFDLLDALTRSGALPIESASLHVILGATHSFDLSLTNTVIEGNVNPIEKVERSGLIVASAILGQPTTRLIQPTEESRVRTFTPSLFHAVE